jgi:hypothetical protein
MSMLPPLTTSLHGVTTQQISRPVVGLTQPPIQWVTEALSLEEKWPGRESNHSPSSSADVKNPWSYTSTPQYTFMAWCLLKNHRDNFMFYIYL